MKFHVVFAVLALVTIRGGHAESDWVLRKTENGIAVSTRSTPGQPIDSGKAETVLNASLDEVYNYILKIPLWKNWYAMCIESILLDSDDKNTKLVYVVIDLPWPFKDRYGILSVWHSLDNSGNRAVFFMNIVTNSEKERFAWFLEDKNYEPIKESNVQITLESTGTAKTKITYEASGDPGIKLPPAILNMASTVQPFQTVNNLKAEIE